MESDPEQPKAACAEPPAKKQRKPQPRRSKTPAQAALYQKWKDLQTKLETAKEVTRKHKGILRRGVDHSMSLEYEITKLTYKKERADAANEEKRAKLVKRAAMEEKLQLQLRDAKEAWDLAPKMVHERSDGQPAAELLYLEMIFAHLWRPGTSADLLRPAVLFQRSCVDWRVAARSYVLANPYFRQRIPRYPWAQSCTIKDCSPRDSYFVFSVKFHEARFYTDPQGRCEEHWVTVPKYQQKYDEFAIVPVLDDPTTCALVMQERRAHDAQRLVSAGGRWTFNVAGDVCDWTKLPVTILQVIHLFPAQPSALTGRLVSLAEVRGNQRAVWVRVPRIDMPSVRAVLDPELGKLVLVDGY